MEICFAHPRAAIHPPPSTATRTIPRSLYLHSSIVRLVIRWWGAPVFLVSRSFLTAAAAAAGPSSPPPPTSTPTPIVRLRMDEFLDSSIASSSRLLVGRQADSASVAVLQVLRVAAAAVPFVRDDRIQLVVVVVVRCCGGGWTRRPHPTARSGSGRRRRFVVWNVRPSRTTMMPVLCGFIVVAAGGIRIVVLVLNDDDTATGGDGRESQPALVLQKIRPKFDRRVEQTERRL